MDLKRNEFLYDATLVLVANKKDLEEYRAVSFNEGNEYA
jgi:hypothetical protein